MLSAVRLYNSRMESSSPAVRNERKEKQIELCNNFFLKMLAEQETQAGQDSPMQAAREPRSEFQRTTKRAGTVRRARSKRIA